MRDCRDREVEAAQSANRVIALANVCENLIRPPNVPWPPPDLIQKIYESRHAGASGCERTIPETTATAVSTGGPSNSLRPT
jgi:hypothetical protein